MNTTAWVLAAAALGSSGEALAQTPARQAEQAQLRPRATVGLMLTTGNIQSSAYNTRATAWGFSGFSSLRTLSADGGYFVLPWLLVGGRVGWGASSGGTESNDGAELALSLYDAGLMARVGYPVRGVSSMGFVGLQLEGGAMLARTTLRGEALSHVVARAGTGIFAQLLFRRAAIGLHLTQRFANWSNAGGAGSDLQLGGTEASVSVEVVL